MKKKDSIIKGIVNSVLPVILAFAFGAIIIAVIGESPLETYGVLILIPSAEPPLRSALSKLTQLT